MEKLYDRAMMKSAKSFSESLIEAVPYRSYTFLIDNSIQFAVIPKNRGGVTAWFRGHPFDCVCWANRTEHRITNFNHLQTNGQVEGMNRTIKETTVNQYYCQTGEEFQKYLNGFIAEEPENWSAECVLILRFFYF